MWPDSIPRSTEAGAELSLSPLWRMDPQAQNRYCGIFVGETRPDKQKGFVWGISLSPSIDWTNHARASNCTWSGRFFSFFGSRMEYRQSPAFFFFFWLSPGAVLPLSTKGILWGRHGMRIYFLECLWPLREARCSHAVNRGCAGRRLDLGLPPRSEESERSKLPSVVIGIITYSPLRTCPCSKKNSGTPLACPHSNLHKAIQYLSRSIPVARTDISFAESPDPIMRANALGRVRGSCR